MQKNKINIELEKLNNNQLKNISGGGWIADVVEKWLCGCSETTSHVTGSAVGIRYYVPDSE